LEGDDPPGRSKPFASVAFVGLLALAAVAGVMVGSAVGRGDGWGCAVERRGHSIVDGLGSGGSASELSAASDWIPILVEDGTVSEQELRAAFEQPSGPNSYDTNTGELRIDGLLQADFAVGQQSDGTWAVSSYTHCMRPPSV
jgi:hypothetical protein